MNNLNSASLSDLFASEKYFDALTDMISDLGLELVSVTVED